MFKVHFSLIRLKRLMNSASTMLNEVHKNQRSKRIVEIKLMLMMRNFCVV